MVMVGKGSRWVIYTRARAGIVSEQCPKKHRDKKMVTLVWVCRAEKHPALLNPGESGEQYKQAGDSVKRSPGQARMEATVGSLG